MLLIDLVVRALIEFLVRMQNRGVVVGGFMEAKKKKEEYTAGENMYCKVM